MRMGSLELLVALFVVDFVAVISPGPNFLLVTATSVREGRPHGLLTVFGIVTANAVWVVGALVGLSLLFELVPFAYSALKIAGGVYLIYLGAQYWREPAGASVGTRATRSQRSAFVRGMLTGITNPKSLVYFGSIFTVFLAPGSPAWVRAAAIGIVLFDTVLWYGTVALLFSRAAVYRAYARVRRPLDRVAGTVMAAFGARIALARG